MNMIARRWFLQQCGIGMGALALPSLLEAAADPLAPKQPPLPAKAKNVIFLFMAGAPSHLEMFDYKPQLAKFDGTLPQPELLKGRIHQPELKAARPEVQVREIRSVRSGGFRTASALLEDRG